MPASVQSMETAKEEKALRELDRPADSSFASPRFFSRLNTLPVPCVGERAGAGV